MKAILAQLNKTQGVRGSMILNRDGIVVASDFSVDVHEPTVGAISSSILSALENALKRINMGKFSRFTITGSENKATLVNAGHAVLFVLLQTDVNMGMVNLEIKQAASAIAENSKMTQEPK